MKTKILSLALLLFLVQTANSQGNFKLDRESSKLSVLGTSTLHDWESDVEEYTVSAQQNNGEILNIRFESKVESIKSGKSAMDKNTYRALNSEKYPKIYFKANKLKVTGSVVKGIGALTIAGKTNNIPVSLKYEKWTENSFQVSGEINLKMTDFGVDPPTAMMGAISTGDDIIIKFEFLMNQ